MNINGYSNDNLHQGDVRITNDLKVDGKIEAGELEINELEVNELNVVNELKVDGYTLPTSAGTDGQVIAMNADNTTTSFKDIFSGTSNLFINRLYATEPNANYPQGGAAQPIYLQREGSATFSPDEVQPGFGFIKVKGRGFFNIDAPPTTTTSLQCLGAWGLNFNSIQFDFGSQFIYTGPNSSSVIIQGWWDIEIVIKSAPTAGNLEITYLLANSNGRDTGGGSYDIQIPDVRSSIRTVGTITTPIPSSNFAIYGTFANRSTSADTTCDAVITEYTMDLMSSSSNVVATSETLTTDHTLLSNLTLGDAGHSQFALLNGRTLGQTLSGGILPAESLKLKSHTAGSDNIDIKDTKTEFKKNIDMDGNNIINANEITKTSPPGSNLELKNIDGPVVISGQGIFSNIQLTTPNNLIVSCNLFESFALLNDFQGNINMNNNSILNPSLISSSTNLDIIATADMKINSDVLDIDSTTAINLNNAGSPKLKIDATQNTSAQDLNMDNNNITNVASINGLTPQGGLSSGTSNSATLGGSTAEQSILANTFVGSRQSPADTFKQGDAYVATLAGNFSSNNGDTLTLRLKGGPTGTTVLSTLVVSLNASAGVYYELEINFGVRQIGAAGVADLAINYDFTYNQSAMGGAFAGERLCEVNNTTFDTTILNQLDITAQFNSTSGSNSIETLFSTLGKTY
jgi:hypothetical protein